MKKLLQLSASAVAFLSLPLTSLAMDSVMVKRAFEQTKEPINLSSVENQEEDSQPMHMNVGKGHSEAAGKALNRASNDNNVPLENKEKDNPPMHMNVGEGHSEAAGKALNRAANDNNIR